MVLRFANLFVLVTFAINNALAAPAQPIFIYEKLSHKSKRINLSVIHTGRYFESRWDSNDDGIIDYWSIAAGNLSLDQTFDHGTIHQVIATAKRSDHDLILTYQRNQGDQLVLVKYEKVFFKKQWQLDIDKLDDVLSDTSKICHGDDKCLESAYLKVLKSEEWCSLQSKLNQETRNNELDALIDSSCEKNLTFSQKKELKEAILNVYGLNLFSPQEHQKLMSCFEKSGSEQLKKLYAPYIRKVTMEVSSRKTPEILCQEIKVPEDCNKASYDRKTDQIQIPISNPPCAKDMKPIFTKALFHEKLHQSETRLPEEFVRTAVKGCLEDDKELLAKLDTIYSSSAKTNASLIGPAAAREAARLAEQDRSANIPTSVAAGSLEPGGGTSSGGSQFAQGMQALNGAFRGVASVGSPDANGTRNPTESVRGSLSRAKAPLAAFAFLGGVDPAMAMDLPTVATPEGDAIGAIVSLNKSQSRQPASLQKGGTQDTGVDAGSVPRSGSPAGSSGKLSGNQNGSKTESGEAKNADQVDKLMRSIAAIKDPAKRKVALDKLKEQGQLENFGIYYYDQDLKLEYGTEMGQAKARYTMIKGKLIKE
jgi:hypothetical protein